MKQCQVYIHKPKGVEVHITISLIPPTRRPVSVPVHRMNPCEAAFLHDIIHGMEDEAGGTE